MQHFQETKKIQIITFTNPTWSDVRTMFRRQEEKRMFTFNLVHRDMCQKSHEVKLQHKWFFVHSLHNGPTQTKGWYVKIRVRAKSEFNGSFCMFRMLQRELIPCVESKYIVMFELSTDAPSQSGIFKFDTLDWRFCEINFFFPRVYCQSSEICGRFVCWAL